MTANINFGQKLRELRKKVDKSQAEVALEISEMFNDVRISQTALSALEQRATAPRQEVLEILCNYYGVPINYFFERDEENIEERTNRAREYLRSLRIVRDELHAHSTEPRNDRNDEIGKSLNNLLRRWDPDFDDPNTTE